MEPGRHERASERTITIVLKGQRRQQQIVLLSDAAMAILLNAEGDDPTHVFTMIAERSSWYKGKLRKRGERIPVRPKTFYQKMAQAFADANIVDFHIHDFRHTFATRLLRACGNLDIVRRCLGHTSDRCTKRYTEMVLDDLKAAMRIRESHDIANRRRAMMMIGDPTMNDVADGLKLKQKIDAELRAAAYAYATAA